MPTVPPAPSALRRWGRRVLLALLVLIGGAAAAAGALLASGYTPGRAFDYLEVRLQGHPKLESLLLPPLALVRRWTGEASADERRSVPFNVPPPPPRWGPEAESAPSGEPRASGRVLRVGSGQRLSTVAQAAREARDGDIVEIEAGDYRGDVAVWMQRQLTIRAVGGNARLWADGKIAEGKAIWVIRNGRFDISGIDFIGARAADRNGAGIRFEGGSLRLRRCLFWDSEAGLLTGGGERQRGMEVHVEASEFGYIGWGDGQSHLLYAGPVARLSVSHSHFHHANVGHLVKSRAAFTLLAYNRLTDESGGRASYEVDLSNGGVAVLVGNLIQQSRQTENSHLVRFGSEGYTHPENRLYLFNNTLVNKHPLGGAFLRAAPGATSVVAANNLLLGVGGWHGDAALSEANNPKLTPEDFVDPEHHDYRLREDPAHARLQWLAPALAEVGGVSLVPSAQYQHPRSLRRLDRPPRWPGAFQDAAAP